MGFFNALKQINCVLPYGHLGKLPFVFYEISSLANHLANDSCGALLCDAGAGNN